MKLLLEVTIQQLKYDWFVVEWNIFQSSVRTMIYQYDPIMVVAAVAAVVEVVVLLMKTMMKSFFLDSLNVVE